MTSAACPTPLHRRAAGPHRPGEVRAGLCVPAASTGGLVTRLLDLIGLPAALVPEEGKTQLTIAVGCTGGQHRSVALAEHLYRHLEGGGPGDLHPPGHPPAAAVRGHTMTFTYKIKSEIYRSKVSGPSAGAQAYGLLLFGKHFGEEAIGLVTENKRVTKLYAMPSPTSSASPKASPSRRPSTLGIRCLPYRWTAGRIGRRCRLFGHREPKASEWRTWRRKGFGRVFERVFLACGNVTDPQKSYHLEFVVPSPGLAQPLCDAIS